MEYDFYTATDCWKKRREVYLSTHGNVCEVCQATTSDLEIHHLSYEHLGAETDSDLIALCDECHRTIHKLSESRTHLRLAIIGLASSIKSQLQSSIRVDPKYADLLAALTKRLWK